CSSDLLSTRLPGIAIESFLERLHDCPARPTLVDYLSPDWPTDGGTLFLGFDEKSAAVDWQIDQLRSTFPEVVFAPEPPERWSQLVECLGLASPSLHQLIVRPSQVGTVLGQIPGRVLAHAATGVLWLFDGPPTLRIGSLNCRRGTGPFQPLTALMEHVRHTVDPLRLFNPGRIPAPKSTQTESAP
ncbi:MAG: hypothetical protein ACRCZF_27410, partial [Gemmataceae bacterium]